MNNIKELQEKYFNKTVKIKTEFEDIVKLQVQNYFVTALLDDVSTYIFAIIGENYKIPENPCWYTIKFATLQELEDFLLKFEVIS
jgi:hypothetical protein